jgi:phosphomannomutase
VVVDAINGAGSVALPELLKKLGVTVVPINCAGNGDFVHEPEPVPENLKQLGRAVRKHKADLGLACDPDADRLALVDERGRPIGEELTLALAIQPVLMRHKGTVVINLSTSRVTADVASSLGAKVAYSKVGEANVVAAMRRRKAIIGGEGNGGVIYPAFHAGRDSLIASALVLTLLAKRKLSLSQLVATLPKYYTIKIKAPLKPGFAQKLKRLEKSVPNLVGRAKLNRLDGLRIDFESGWIQLRTSNTEPIYRLIVETDSESLSRRLLAQVRRQLK